MCRIQLNLFLSNVSGDLMYNEYYTLGCQTANKETIRFNFVTLPRNLIFCILMLWKNLLFLLKQFMNIPFKGKKKIYYLAMKMYMIQNFKFNFAS